MAGRKQFDEDAAVRAAMNVFWARGYADTSIDDLSAATGLLRGSLYNAFGSKDALFCRALDLYGEIYGDRYDQALSRHPSDPGRAIRAYFEVVLRRLADPEVPDGCLLAQSVIDTAALEPAGSERAQTLFAAQRRRVRAAMARAGLAARTVDELTNLIVCVQQGMVVLHRAGVPISQLRANARLTAEAVTARLAVETSARTAEPVGAPSAG